MTIQMQGMRSVVLSGASLRGKLCFLMLLAALSAGPAFAQQAVDAAARAQDTTDDDCDDKAEDRKSATAGSPTSCDHAINTKGTGTSSGRSMPAAAGISGTTTKLAIKTKGTNVQRTGGPVHPGSPETCDHAINTKGTGAHTGRVSGAAGSPASCDHAINTKGTGVTSGKKGYDYYQARGTLQFRAAPYAAPYEDDGMRTFGVTLDPDSDGDMLPESGELRVTCVKGAATDVRFVKRHVGQPKYGNKYTAPINVSTGTVTIRKSVGNEDGDGIALESSPDLAHLCH